MNHDDIKRNLAGYRPELYSEDDPLIVESLRAAKADPELNAWLEEEIAFDRELAASLSNTQPPENAKSDLLNAYKEQQASSSASPSFASPLTYAIAAILLLSTAGIIKYVFFPPPPEIMKNQRSLKLAFRQQMADFAGQQFVIDKGFDKLSDSNFWLEEQDYPSFSEIPEKLIQYRGMGCKKIDWNGTKVGLICFHNSLDEVVHLFILNREDLSPNRHSEDSHELERFVVSNGRETKGWESEEQLFLLVGSQPGVTIGQIL